MSGTTSAGMRRGAGLMTTAVLVTALAAVTAPPAGAARPASSSRGCTDVRLVWAGGEAVRVVEGAFAKGVSVRTTVVAEPGAQLTRDEWPAVEEQGLAHPYFAGAARAARSALATMEESVARCPRTALVLGGHSDGAVAARLVLRRLDGAKHRAVRSRLTRVVLLGDPALERRQRVALGDRAPFGAGLLAGASTRLPAWARGDDLVAENCRFDDSFCGDPGPFTPAPGGHYQYEGPGAGDWAADLVAGSVVPSRVDTTMLTRGDALDGPSLGLSALRLQGTGRLPEGLRIQRRSTGDRIVGRPPVRGASVVVRARPLGTSASLARRLTISIDVQRPGGRRGTVLVTRGIDGRPADGPSWGVVVSASGSTVGFTSSATNLVRRGPRSGSDAYVWDRRTGRHELVGILPDGSAATSSVVDMSADGRRVLFRTYLDTGETRSWVRDRDRGTTVPVADDAQLDQGGHVVTYPEPEAGWSWTDAASADGRYVVMARWDFTTGVVPLRVWDNRTAAVVHTSELTTDDQGRGQYPDALSGDGRYLALSGHPASVVDLTTGRIVSSSTSGVMGISDDGRWSLAGGVAARRDGVRLSLARVARSGSLDLVPGSPRVRDLVEPFGSASVSADGTAVAYAFGGDLIAGQDRIPDSEPSNVAQIYHWQAR